MKSTSIRGRIAQLNLTETETYKQGKELLCLCPFHDDSKASFSINLQTGQWYCYTGCGGGSLEQLEQRLSESSQWQPQEAVTTEAEPVPVHRTPVLKSFLERGFTREMLAPWGIVWDEEHLAMRIPVCDDAGRPLANIWRYPEGVVPKYRYDVGFEKSACVWGSWKLLPEMKSITLVEGTLDAVWIWAAGQPAGAILGSTISAAQVHILTLHNIRRVNLCLDNDPAGREGTMKAAALLRASGFWVYSIAMPQRFNDIQDVPLDEVSDVLDNAMLYVNHSGMFAPRLKRWMNN